jgi:hypothetical protein
MHLSFRRASNWLFARRNCVRPGDNPAASNVAVRILFRCFALFAEAFYSKANAADYFDGFSSCPCLVGISAPPVPL